MHPPFLTITIGHNPSYPIPKMKKLFTILAVAVLISGCASSGRKLDESALNKIEKGKTTKAEVLQLIGSPEQITRTSGGQTIFTYMYCRATAKGSTFIPIVGAFAGGMNVQNQMAQITFGQDGVVSDFVTTYGANDVSQGVTTGSKPDISGVEDNKRPK